MEDIIVLSAKRTAIGAFQGAFSNTPAPRLGAAVIKDALLSAGVNPDQVEECIMGNVITAGTGQGPARQAAIYADLPKSVECLTINKLCGSGLKAIALAVDTLKMGHSQLIVAGGQENMTLAPHLLEKSRSGFRMGNVQLSDSMLKDGLWDPYNDIHMGNCGEICAREYHFTREAQDSFAVNSYKRAQKATSDGTFKNEITPIEVSDGKKTTLVSVDEEPGRAKFDKIPELKPAFEKTGTITAANASKINDGASAVVLTTSSHSKKLGLKPIARILAQASFAQDPKWFTTAPVGAIKKALLRANLEVSDIDLWEINEAFAVVPMAAIKELKIDSDKVNIHGGAIALGHPIGASGARVFTTLINALQIKKLKYGVASLCIGGGEGIAVVIERL